MQLPFGTPDKQLGDRGRLSAGDSTDIVVLSDSPVYVSALEEIIRYTSTLRVRAHTTALDEALRTLEAQANTTVLVATFLASYRCLVSQATATIRTLRGRFPRLPILAIVPYLTLADTQAFLHAGASGLCFPSIESLPMLEGIKSVASGREWLGPELEQLLGLRGRSRRKRVKLTLRQVEVLDMIYNGLDNQTIAVRLCCTSSNVKAHLHAIYRKLGVTSRAQAAAIAARWRSASDANTSHSAD
ncbi:response regulator transcription factor [bacterium]|nr:MAG: response regulator transcription factor [bacterium]